jgi:ATP-binding cassette subfamily F protein 3
MDEPDVFLDFEHMNGLCELINSYEGTLLVITHNRYLLNHCFDKILHLEDADIQEFEGNFVEYNFMLLKKKIEMQEQVHEEQEEIARTEQVVDRMRTKATQYSIASLGRAVHAKQTYLDRLRARAIKAPFVEMRLPKIKFPKVEVNSEETVLKVTDYKVEFDEVVLEDVNFELKANEKVAIVGANGTGKTTLFYDIIKNQHPAISIPEHVEVGFLSQFFGHIWDEKMTVCEEFFRLGFEKREDVAKFLKRYYFTEEMLDQRIEQLSGGEQNLLQIALIANTDAEFLILDEPTSHLDIYAQMALERAVAEYKGTVLMVSHDFYLVANSADYVLLVEENTVRRMRTRNFRKMVYDKYFDQKYLEIDKKKQQLETDIRDAFGRNAYVTVGKLCDQLEEISK